MSSIARNFTLSEENTLRHMWLSWRTEYQQDGHRLPMNEHTLKEILDRVSQRLNGAELLCVDRNTWPELYFAALYTGGYILCNVDNTILYHNNNVIVFMGKLIRDNNRLFGKWRINPSLNVSEPPLLCEYADDFKDEHWYGFEPDCTDESDHFL